MFSMKMSQMHSVLVTPHLLKLQIAMTCACSRTLTTSGAGNSKSQSLRQDGHGSNHSQTLMITGIYRSSHFTNSNSTSRVTWYYQSITRITFHSRSHLLKSMCFSIYYSKEQEMYVSVWAGIKEQSRTRRRLRCL